MSLLAAVTALLQGIDAVRAEDLAGTSPHGTTMRIQTDTLAQAQKGLHLLLYCPPEYLSKSSRADILRRAVIFDMALTAVGPASVEDTNALRAARTLLQRTFRTLGTTEHPVRIHGFMMQSPSDEACLVCAGVSKEPNPIGSIWLCG